MSEKKTVSSLSWPPSSGGFSRIWSRTAGPTILLKIALFFRLSFSSNTVR